MSSPIFKSKRHDDGVSPEITVTPPAGLGFNLQEAGMTVFLIARLPDAPAHKMRGQAVVVGPWTIRYDPTKADVDTIGTYDVEVSAVRSNGKQITFPTEKANNLKWVIDSDADNQ
jgi:hypothetical protein